MTLDLVVMHHHVIMFYDLSKTLSFNALLNFIIGERGVGKTFSAKKFVINDYLKNGHQFVYLRRYKTELDMAMEGFFSQLQEAGLFHDCVFEIKTSKKAITKFLCNGEVIGFAMPMSTANILKSASFEKVRTIVFDEFIIDKGTYHYLQNEVIQFLDVIETVARLRDVRVLLLGNAISITNPYFNFFDLSLPYGSEYKTFKDGLILVNYIKNMEYREKKKSTRFGKLIEGTEYGKYAIDNEFLRDSKAFIAKRPKAAKNYSTIIVGGDKFGIWRDWHNGFIIVSNDYDPSNPCTFAFSASDHNEQTILVKARGSSWFAPIIEAYREGLLYFESQKIKNAFMPILNKCLNY